MNLEEGRKEEGKKLLEELVKYIPTDNFPPRMLFADDLLRFGFSDLALNCLKPFIKYNENAELKYIRMLINTGEEVYILEAEILLNERLTDQTHNLNLLKLKIDLLSLLSGCLNRK